MSAVPALILGGTIAGGLVCSAVVLGGSIVRSADKRAAFLPAATKLADAVAGIADTLHNGPRKPYVLQMFTGRRAAGGSGCATILAAAPKPGCCSWVLAFHGDALAVCLLSC